MNATTDGYTDRDRLIRWKQLRNLKCRKKPNRWAIVIGISFYMPRDEDKDGIFWASLPGSAESADSIKKYLEEKQHMKSENIKVLTARGDSDLRDPTEPKDQWPTVENIKRVFKEVENGVVAGDLVYIHYIGHGTREDYRPADPTKPSIMYRHSLVPTDINRNSEYLPGTDIEEALRKIVGRNTFVTVVLDCCYSGQMAGGNFLTSTYILCWFFFAHSRKTPRSMIACYCPADMNCSKHVAQTKSHV